MNYWRNLVNSNEKISKLSNFTFYHKNKYGNVLLKCLCDCGNECIKYFSDISKAKRNNTQCSCGCSRVENGLKQGLLNKKFNINNKIFEESPEKSYIIGLLSADGFNSNKGIYIALQYRDSHILEELKNFLEYTGSIKYDKNKNRSILTICSKALSSYLKDEEGIISNKTENFKVLDKYKYDTNFWRGVVDGDGCVYYYKYKLGVVFGISLVGTYNMINSFKNYCNTIIKIDNKIQKIKNSIVYSISITGNKAVPILEQLYKKYNGKLVLNRKKEKVDFILDKVVIRQNEIFNINNNWNLQQYDLTGKLIRTIISKDELFKIFPNANISNIRKAAKNNTTSLGYKWIFLKEK